MIQIFRITNAPDAPRLRLANPFAFDEAFMRFDGEEKGLYSPHDEFELIADPCVDVYQFYNFAPGILAGPVDGLCECTHMLYATIGNTERLSMIAGDVPFIGINPIDPLPPLEKGPKPWLETLFVPVFRLQGWDHLELFCISGLHLPLDEFKNVYDRYGFRGLLFEEVWRSS